MASSAARYDVTRELEKICKYCRISVAHLIMASSAARYDVTRELQTICKYCRISAANPRRHSVQWMTSWEGLLRRFCNSCILSATPSWRHSVQRMTLRGCAAEILQYLQIVSNSLVTSRDWRCDKSVRLSYSHAVCIYILLFVLRVLITRCSKLICLWLFGQTTTKTTLTFEKSGINGIRTHDLSDYGAMLWQLSQLTYVQKCRQWRKWRFWRNFVG